MKIHEPVDKSQVDHAIPVKAPHPDPTDSEDNTRFYIVIEPKNDRREPARTLHWHHAISVRRLLR